MERYESSTGFCHFLSYAISTSRSLFQLTKLHRQSDPFKKTVNLFKVTHPFFSLIVSKEKKGDPVCAYKQTSYVASKLRGFSLKKYVLG